MILLETIHAGVPIVASAVGGVPDLLAPGTGLAGAAERSRLHSRRRWTRCCPIPARRPARAVAARARVAEHFSPGEWVSRHLAVYQRVMERRAR